MLPDFENAQKWRRWLKTKRFYKLWLFSPIVFAVIVGILWKQNAKLSDDLEEARNEVIPIRELYPKLELSAAVAKLIESHDKIKGMVDLAAQKEEQKRFVPLSAIRAAKFKEETRNLVKRHAGIDFNVKVLAVSPGTDLYKKARELTSLFAAGGIKARYSNTMFSSQYNVVVKCSEALPRDVLNEINELLKIVFKNTLYFVLLKSGGEDSDGNINIYFLGTPSFDNEGCVFYDIPMH